MLDPTEKLLPLSVVARLVRVPAAWLQGEVDAGRLPSLRAGRRILLDPEAVEAELLRRARGLPSPAPVAGNEGPHHE